MNLKEFIEKNKISFEEGSRNSSVTTLIGYALYKGVSQDQLLEELEDEINEDGFIEDEIMRLWEYCKYRNYGNWWETEEAKSLYKF